MKKYSVEYLDEDGRYHVSHVMADSVDNARLEAIKLDEDFYKTLTISEIEEDDTKVSNQLV